MEMIQLSTWVEEVGTARLHFEEESVLTILFSIDKFYPCLENELILQ